MERHKQNFLISAFYVSRKKKKKNHRQKISKFHAHVVATSDSQNDLLHPRSL